MTGAPFRIARSMILQIFSAWASGERAAEDGEVLGEDIHQPAVDPARAGDHAVAGKHLLLQSEIGGPVGDEAVELHEAAFVEQEVEPLAGGELALLVLLGDPVRSPALFGERLAVMEFVEEFAGVGHRGGKIAEAPKAVGSGAAGRTQGKGRKDLVSIRTGPLRLSAAAPSYSVAALSSIYAGLTGGMIGSSG